jgi:hypothetical protein
MIHLADAKELVGRIVALELVRCSISCAYQQDSSPCVFAPDSRGAAAAAVPAVDVPAGPSNQPQAAAAAAAATAELQRT